MNRRNFLHTSASASILAGSTQSLLALADDNVYRKNIGLQIYTLRDQLKSDLKGTLKAVAEARLSAGGALWISRWWRDDQGGEGFGAERKFHSF